MILTQVDVGKFTHLKFLLTFTKAIYFCPSYILIFFLLGSVFLLNKTVTTFLSVKKLNTPIPHPEHVSTKATEYCRTRWASTPVRAQGEKSKRPTAESQSPGRLKKL